MEPTSGEELYPVQLRKVDEVEYESTDPGSFLGCRIAHFCFRAKHRTTDQPCFIVREFKKFEEKGQETGNNKMRVKREVSILLSLSSCNHVRQCIDIFEHGYWICRVYESLPQRSYDAMSVYWDFQPGTVRSIMHQILIALDHCHSKQIAHGLVQPRSVLLIPNDQENHNFHVKLTNFEFAHHFVDRQYYPPTKDFSVKSLYYDAPELLLAERLSSSEVLLGDAASDIWAAGATFFELFAKRPLFPGISKIDTIFKIFRQLGTPTNHNWPGVSNLPNYSLDFPNWKAIPWPTEARVRLNEAGLHFLGKLLTLDPQKRITAQEALRHSYFKE